MILFVRSLVPFRVRSHRCALYHVVSATVVVTLLIPALCASLLLPLASRRAGVREEAADPGKLREEPFVFGCLSPLVSFRTIGIVALLAQHLLWLLLLRYLCCTCCCSRDGHVLAYCYFAVNEVVFMALCHVLVLAITFKRHLH